MKGGEFKGHRWSGLDRHGRPVGGLVDARNARFARAELRRRGIRSIRLGWRLADWSMGVGSGKISARALAVFSRQLATLLVSGVPLVQAFELIARGQDKAPLRELLLGIKARLEAGEALHQALAQYPTQFDALTCSLVSAGEQAGVLDQILTRIADHRERSEALRGKLKKALFYPIAVLLVAILVTLLILLLVVPQFKALFESFDTELPAFTQAVIVLSDGIRTHWLLGLSVIALLVLLAAWLYRGSGRLQLWLERLRLRLPVIGPILHQGAIARFARTLSTLFAAGVPLVDGLGSTIGTSGSRVYAQAIRRMRSRVESGETLERAMRETGLFPQMAIQMVAIGEESGALEAMLAKIADFNEREVGDAVDGLSSLLEPTIMVIIGGLVGALVVSMYLPVFRMASVV